MVHLENIPVSYFKSMHEGLDAYSKFLHENLIIECGNTRNSIKGLDLFGGCGGLSYGLHKSGIDMCYAVDNSIEAMTNYQLNIKSSNAFCKDASKFLKKIKSINELKKKCAEGLRNMSSSSNPSNSNNELRVEKIKKIRFGSGDDQQAELKIVWNNNVIRRKQWIKIKNLEGLTSDHWSLLRNFLDKVCCFSYLYG